MKAVGIICEYNPFHNGHLYHLNKVKELCPEDVIILVTSTAFTQHGEVCLINKWDKTKLALELGIDLVIELPFNFATQSADKFAYGAINILNQLKVSKIVFGSELDDVNTLEKLAEASFDDKYDDLVKSYLDKKLNYPTALSKALYDLTKVKIEKPNDILGICYIKEIKKLNSPIKPISIKRNNDYHSELLTDDISSATSIRKALVSKKDISDYVPKETIKYINNVSTDDFFPYLKYKIISEDDLSKYVDVDEGIENRIKKYIHTSSNFNDLIENIKTKRYTYSRIKRMLIHILCDFKKSDVSLELKYIRVLGFNGKGRKYLNMIKKNVELPILTKYSSVLDPELKISSVYSLVFDDDLVSLEYKNKPIIK